VASTTAGLSRVTIVAPRTRVDLALPSEVPLADVLPTLLRFAGQHLSDEPEGRYGWTLSRLGAPTLDISRTPVQLEIRDGELLYLRPRGADAPEPVFDDIVDAVATATRSRSGRWQAATSRWFGLGLGALALVSGAFAVVFAGPPHVAGALTAAILAAALLATAAVAARAFNQNGTGVLLALMAICYAAAGGLVVFAGDRPVSTLAAPHVLVAAAAVMLVSAVAAVAVATAVHVFLASGAAAVALGIAATICLVWDATPAAGASAALVVALATVPALPMLAYRMAGLPVPSVPTGPDDLRTDTETVDGRRVLDLAERADEFLAGLLGGVAVIAAGAAVALVATGGLAGVILCTVVGLLLMSRARWVLGINQRLPLLAAGVVSLGAVTLAVFASAGLVGRLAVVLVALLGLAAISIGYAVGGAGRRRSPMWGRTLDILEIVLVLGVLPLAVWVSGLYSWMRSIRG
jgi:type VII secretion integral membrane protein EccD